MRRISARLLLLVFLFSFAVTDFLAQSPTSVARPLTMKSSPPRVHGSALADRMAGLAGGSNTQLPTWSYQVISSRDGNLYEGLIVGSDPSTRGPSASVAVRTQVVPIILKFHSVATAINLKTGIFTTAPGNVTSDPTAHQPGCFAGTQNVPLQLLEQSPILRNADFNFGGTDVGTTQYTDAFQRASFWSQIDKANYHVRLGPIQIYPPVVLQVPAAQGLSIPTNLFEPAFSLCGREGIVDIDFLDAFVVNELTKLPGITPGTFPMFMIYNAGMSFGPPTNINNCCAGGYHGINPAGPLAFQTYSPFDFENSGLFSAAFNNTTTVSHEIAEWINDPYVINATPPWGHTGQVGGCQANLEVGDPLSGTDIQRIFMPNGFTYQLQELAFFSWFFGAPSLGIHGWFSDDATFLTDAGPPCM
jgi:hypothetical protein